MRICTEGKQLQEIFDQNFDIIKLADEIVHFFRIGSKGLPDFVDLVHHWAQFSRFGGMSLQMCFEYPM